MTQAVAPLWWDEFISDGLADFTGTLSDITFPDTRLHIRVLIALDADLSAEPSTWAWEDVAGIGLVRFDPGIEISDGRQDESSTVTTATARFTVDNRDGRFSRRNPTGAYYGKLSKNTPIWIEVDPGDGGHTRFQGFVNSWPVRWRAKGLDSVAEIECSGILRRLQQTPGQVQSAARRSFTGSGALSSNLVMYFPFEDTPGLTTVASTPISGAPPSFVHLAKRVTYGETGPKGAAGAAFVVSGPLNFLSGDIIDSPAITLPIASHTAGEMVLSFWFQGSPFTETAGAPTDAFVCFIESWLNFPSTSALGSVRIWATEVYPYTGASSDSYVSADGAASPNGGGGEVGVEINTIGSFIQVFDGNWHQVQLRMAQSGSDITMALYLDGTQYDSQTIASTTLAAPTEFKVAAIGYVQNSGATTVTQNTVMRISTVTLHNSSSVDVTDLYDAGNGYDGEQAHTRISRICTEENVRYTSLASTSVTMGPQPVADPITILREAEKADQGVLYEHDFGLAYQSVAERYNAPVGLSLDFDQGHIATEPQPADDDQRTRNLWTVSRSAGSSVTVEQVTGELGTAKAGTWRGSETVNVEDDDDLSDAAGWRAHLGTVDEDRWPSITMRMHATPELIPDWTSLGYGARAQVANPPGEVAPDTIDAIIEGHVEHIDTVTWDAEIVTSPASPYQIAIVGDTATSTDVPRIGSTTATITAALDSSSTGTVSVSTGSDGPWTTSTSDVPMSVNIGGERITVSAISSLVTDNFGRTISNGWGTADSGQSWSTSGGSVSDYSVSGNFGIISLGTVSTARYVTTGAATDVDEKIQFKTAAGVFATGDAIRAALVARFADGNNHYQFLAQLETNSTVTARLIKRASGVETVIASSTVSGLTWQSDSFHYIRAKISGSTLMMKVWYGGTSEPGSWAVTATDTTISASGAVGVAAGLNSSNTNTLPVVLSFDGFEVADPQTFTISARSVNAVTKSHDANSSISPWRTATEGL